jgi:RNA polymerase sigma-70 factor (ECF subfamily)
MGGYRRAFEPTVWTVVLRARDEKALGALVEHYWKPCYFYIRRKGHRVEDAKDLTQGFFTHLIKQDALAHVTKSKGRFRSFLLTCLDHFLGDERDRYMALKRGPKPLSLDFEGAETELGVSKEETPERAYRRKWALDIMDRALRKLEEEQGPRFEALQGYITAGRPKDLRALAARLGTTEGNVKVMLHRARARYGELLRCEIARTVEDPAEVEEELKELFAALS